MKKLFGLIAPLALLVLALGGCAQGAQAITQAYLRDSIFSIEPRANGTFTVWMTHDDVGSYCTNDPSIIAQAKVIFDSPDPTAVIEYRSINANDPEWTWFDGMGGGCAAEAGTSHITYLLEAVYTLDGYQKFIAK